jgi:hypothetical protein
MWSRKVVVQSYVPLPEFLVSSDEYSNLLAATPSKVSLSALSGLYGTLNVTYGILLHNIGLGRPLLTGYRPLICGAIRDLAYVESRLRLVAGSLTAGYPPDAQLAACRKKSSPVGG